MQRARRSHSLEGSSIIPNLSRVVFQSIFHAKILEMKWTGPNECIPALTFTQSRRNTVLVVIASRGDTMASWRRTSIRELQNVRCVCGVGLWKSSNHLQSEFGNSRVSVAGSSRLLGLLLNQPLFLLLFLLFLLLLLLLLWLSSSSSSSSLSLSLSSSLSSLLLLFLLVEWHWHWCDVVEEHHSSQRFTFATCDKEELPVPAPLFSVTAKADKEKVPLPEAHDPATGHGRWLYEAWGELVKSYQVSLVKLHW